MKRILILMLLLLAILINLIACSRVNMQIFGTVKDNQTGAENSVEKESSQETTEDQAISLDDLIGSWSSVCRKDNSSLHFDYISLNADCSAEYDYGALMSAYYAPPELGIEVEDGWYRPGMGYATTYGSYTLDGNTLTISYTHNEFDRFQEPNVYIYEIVSVKDGIMTLEDGTRYVRSELYDSDYELCDILGVDRKAGPEGWEYLPIKKEDILGTWESIRRVDNHLSYISYTLEADGTVEQWGTRLLHNYYDPFPDTDGWYVEPMGHPSAYGTYEINGTDIIMTMTHADYGEYDEPSVITLNLMYLENDFMGVGDVYRKYVKIADKYQNEEDMYASLCDLLGVDYSAG